jgi:hypothetical protein
LVDASAGYHGIAPYHQPTHAPHTLSKNS